MSISRVQLTGGNFQDCEGNPLSLGYLFLRLSSDEEVNDSLICSGIEIRIQLDINGNVVTSPGQFVWGNDQMSPSNSFYMVTGFTAAGQIAFGPNNQQVVGNGGTFDTGTWVPNKVISWTPSLQTPEVEVNGTLISSQSPVNFVNSTSVTFTNPTGGEITATASSSPVVPNFLLTTSSFGSETDLSEAGAMSFLTGCTAAVISVPVAFTFRHVGLVVGTGFASTFGTMAIYSLDGTTKIFDAGTNAFDTHASGFVVATLGSPFTLPAGQYLCAWNNTDGSGQHVQVLGIPEAPVYNGSLAPFWQAAGFYVQASNGISGGNMPSSLGTLTWPVPGQAFTIPCFTLY